MLQSVVHTTDIVSISPTNLDANWCGGLRDIQTIIRCLFEPDDIVELRCIRNQEVIQRWVYARELPAIAEKLTAWNQQGYNIYYGVNPRRDMGKSGDSNVLLARALFCDFDHIEPGDGCGRFELVYTDILLTGLPEPTLAVHSGHGLHCYWRLNKPMTDLVLWRKIQIGLNERVNADRNVKNPERVMRLPGFLNTKRKPFQECFICWSTAHANS